MKDKPAISQVLPLTVMTNTTKQHKNALFIQTQSTFLIHFSILQITTNDLQ